jgi:hypothetical protein
LILTIDAYGGVPDDERERLLTMHQQRGRKEWWEQHDLQLLSKAGNYLGLEAIATTLQAYDPPWSMGWCKPPTTPAR